MLRVVGLATVALLAASCKKQSPVASVDAAPSAAVIEPVAPLPVPELPPVDLLFLTPAKIAVSSTVDNPMDFPEHLIDLRPDTAWNGKTGDLVGGFIAVRIPKDAHIDRFEITPGFDKTALDGTDLFTANHRIKRIKVTLDGALIGEHTLDVESRKAQSIKVDKHGGDLKIEVLETVPGTKKQWRELTVSEFHVYGKTGTELRENGQRPRIMVGSLDQKDVSNAEYERAMNGVFESPDAFCKKQKEMIRTFLERENMQDNALGIGPSHPSCTWRKNVRHDIKPPFLELASVSYEDGSEVSSTLLKTEKGWRLAKELGSSAHSHFDMGCPVNHYASYVTSIEQKDTTPPSLVVITQTEMRGQYLEHIMKRDLVICRLENDVLRCDKSIPIMHTLVNEFPSEGKPVKLPNDAPYEVTSDGRVKLLKGDGGP